MKFSEVVRKAKEQGFTEPDPRDDLSGLDVARKALILARMVGADKKLSDIQIESLFVDGHMIFKYVHQTRPHC